MNRCTVEIYQQVHRATPLAFLPMLAFESCSASVLRIDTRAHSATLSVRLVLLRCAAWASPSCSAARWAAATPSESTRGHAREAAVRAEPRRPSSLACARGVVTTMGLVTFAARCVPPSNSGRGEWRGSVSSRRRRASTALYMLCGERCDMQRALRRAASFRRFVEGGGRCTTSRSRTLRGTVRKLVQTVHYALRGSVSPLRGVSFGARS